MALRLRLPVLVALAVFAALPRLAAQITFTFTGVDLADSSPFSASFTTAAAFPAVDQPQVSVNTDTNNVVTDASYTWAQGPAPGAVQLFTSATSTAFAGDYRPGDNRIAGFGFQTFADSPTQQLVFAMLDNSDSGTGLIHGADVPVRFVYAIIPGAFGFTAPADGEDAIAYFARHTGTFDAGVDSGLMLSDQMFGGNGALYSATFAITRVTISGSSAVPEPATCAALAGLAGLGLAACRRRRSRLAR